jgi:diadenylate cyclase
MLELFKIGFLNFTLLDLVDIIVVSVAFYWLYKALKNTIAVQILFGLVILIGLSFITEAVNLKSINWILRTISDIWLIAFIVLFQPELRRMLLMITQGPIFKFFGRSNISQTIDEVVYSAIEMSEKHIGALVVFTRSQNVEMSIDTGIPISAKVSKELILSVFNTKSPLHDGAIIIDNQMLVAARCVLPLSHATKYENKNLGTRHRAALGLSEQIDALILVVSEETGAISIAQNAKFTLDINKEELLKVLNNKLSTKKQV